MSGLDTFLNTVNKSGIVPLIGTIGAGIGLAKNAFGSADFPKIGGSVPGLSGIKTPGFSLSGNVLTRSGGSLAGARDSLLSRLKAIQSGQAGLAGNAQGLRTRFGEIAASIGEQNNALHAANLASINRFERLAGEVTPGFGRLTESAVDTIRARREEAVGNLRESLRKRRVRGASFADSEIARADLAFAQQEERARAEAIVGEIQLRRELEAARANLVANASQMNIQALSEQAEAFALQAGLDQQQAQLFKDQVATIKAESDVMNEAVLSDLKELGVAGTILAGMQGIIQKNAAFDIENEIAAAIAQGESQGEFFNFLSGATKIPTLLDGGLTGGSGFNLASLFGGGGGGFGPVTGGAEFGVGSGGAAEALGLTASSLAPGSSAASAAGAGFGTAAGGEFAAAPTAAFFGEGGLSSGAAAASGGSTLFGGAGAPLGGLGLAGPAIALGIAGLGFSRVFDGDEPPDPRTIPVWRNLGATLESGNFNEQTFQALVQRVGGLDAFGMLSDFATGQTKNREFGVPVLSSAARARARKFADRLRPVVEAMDADIRSRAGI